MVWWKSPNNNRVALETLRFTFTANGKRQTNVENFSE